jgi:hypothetical protein
MNAFYRLLERQTEKLRSEDKEILDFVKMAQVTSSQPAQDNDDVATAGCEAAEDLDKKDRFQYQPWYVKLWRYRWYLTIPLDVFKIWLYDRTSETSVRLIRYSLENYIDIATSSAQIKMNWVYDLEDLTFRRPKNKKE